MKVMSIPKIRVNLELLNVTHLGDILEARYFVEIYNDW
jgi:hypothetical protein